MNKEMNEAINATTLAHALLTTALADQLDPALLARSLKAMREGLDVNDPAQKMAGSMIDTSLSMLRASHATDLAEPRH